MGLNAGSLAALTQPSNGVPKGYLRVLVFNTDSVLVAQRTVQLSQAALNNYEVLRVDTLAIRQDGYVSVYVGNESAVDVLFDDVQVEYRQGLLVQQVQYDPAGLELAGLAAPSPGIRGLNNYRFNGKEFQADLGLSWNHQDWRFFDPQLLRWHAGDPEIENGQESWTPYSFSYDNAVRYADADGRCPGGCPPGVTQAQSPTDLLPELPVLLDEAQKVLTVVAGAVGLTALGAWIGNHLPSTEQMSKALATSGGAGFAQPGMYSPYMQMYTDSKAQAAVKDANGRVEARPARRIADRVQKPANNDAVPPRSSFRKKTITDSWDNAKDGKEAGTKACPTCGKDVKGDPNKGESRSGKDGWDGSHNPSWSKRDNRGKTRQQQLDNYNSGVGLECIGCNRSRGANDAANPANQKTQ